MVPVQFAAVVTLHVGLLGLVALQHAPVAGLQGVVVTSARYGRPHATPFGLALSAGAMYSQYVPGGALLYVIAA